VEVAEDDDSVVVGDGELGGFLEELLHYYLIGYFSHGSIVSVIR
jgi:hypothetical protein